MKNFLKSIFALSTIALFAVSCADEAPTGGNQSIPASMVKSQEEIIKRGEYLVTVMGCHDCHSPKIMTPHGPAIDPERPLSGHPSEVPIGKIDPKLLASGDWMLFNSMFTAWVGPWGVSFAANLTPDDTGIGLWTEEQFIRALRQGKFKGMENGRPLLPPMPWENFAQLTDEDLHATFTYLKSIKPIRNIVPNPIPPDALAGIVKPGK